MKNTLLKNLLLLTVALLVAGPARADRLELTDGSIVFGKLVSAEAGKFKDETAFAGAIEIAQDKIKSFTTAEAVNVGLTGGNTVHGRVVATPGGISVAATAGAMSAPTAQVTAVWATGADSPETRAAKELAAKLQRKWAFEASFALAGRTGASEKFGTSLGFKATLGSAQDKLVFAAAAERARDNGVETANREFGSADYSAFFSPDNGWSVRTSLEKDTIKALDLRSTTGFGFDRRLIKNAKQDLDFRLGVNYIYEAYANNTNFGSAGLDIAFLHSYQFAHSKLVNSITYTPAFKDFSNYRVHHESAFEMPLAASQWKLKLGVANDYQGKPPAGTERLDTTYFTSLLLNWH